MNPKLCECGSQGYVIDSRQYDTHVHRRYECCKSAGCGKRWSTRETRLAEGATGKDLVDSLVRTYSTVDRDNVADKLIQLAQDLLKQP